MLIMKINKRNSYVYVRLWLLYKMNLVSFHPMNFTIALKYQSDDNYLLGANIYSIENKPNGLPSVSTQIEQKPNSPIENLERLTIPPAAVIRDSSTLAS